MSIFTLLEDKLKKTGVKYRLVFPEGNEQKVLEAASKLAAGSIVEPILLGNPQKIMTTIRSSKLTYPQPKIIDYQHDSAISELVPAFIAARGKEVAKADVLRALNDANYYATMLVKIGKADGMVSGVAHSTADTVRPALQLIHTAAGMKRVSGSFIMERGAERYIFADCAINPEPDSKTLAEIAYQSVATARMIDLEPRVAFLSFSTKGSAKGIMVDRVAEAYQIFAHNHPNILADGELQFDAAFVPEVARKKAPTSSLKGRANIFIFPELQSGNIAYKMTQRLGNFTAIGPILQGIAQPINDLSRGASRQDIYNMAILTAAQVSAEGE